MSDERALAFDLNPHISPTARSAQFPCPYGACDGSGFVLDDEENVAKPCRCREQRISLARSRSLRHEIPEKYQHVAFDRPPVTEMDPMVVRAVRWFCDGIDENLDRGRGMCFYGPTPGTGKTTLAMLISQHALRRRRSVAIYTGPQLLSAIRMTYEQSATQSYGELIERLRAVDLLHLEDLAVARPTEWVLEQLYMVINDRYQDERSVIFTADVETPDELAKHVGERTYSRLMEMCPEQIPLHGRDRRVAPY